MILTKNIITKNVSRNIRSTIENNVDGFDAKPSGWGGVGVMNVSLRQRFLRESLFNGDLYSDIPESQTSMELKRFLRESVF